jgi:serine protease
MRREEGSAAMLRAQRFGVTAAVATLAMLGMVVTGPASASDESSTPATAQDASPEVLGLIVRTATPTVTKRSIEETMTEAGADVAGARSLTATLDVIDFEAPLTFAEAAPIAAALEERADVIAVGPNRRVYTLNSPVIPNDPLFGQQWSMWNGGGATDYSTRAATMWSRTTGTSNVVVGIIDTGSTNHPDLAGTTVPGFDFIESATDARDGNSWDPDPSDQGDWCPAEGTSSDWHGTHVQGIINAVQGNGTGISGLAPSVKVQHLRTIGACGGTGADILSAVIWGSGGNLSAYSSRIPGQNPGINPTPASVLNLSLGGAGECDALSQMIFDEARARGTTIVVASGNESTAVSTSWPANCQRVVAVASSTRSGTLSSFSNYGTAADQITITAPGSSILSTINNGSTVPTTPGYGLLSGTSMATPHVAAAAAVLYSLGVTRPDDVTTALRAAVQPFPAGASCTVIRCGAGLLDASRLSRPMTVPGVPTNPSARATSTTSARVTWGAPTDNGGASITSYAVRGSQGGGPFIDLGWTGSADTSTTIGSLESGATYSFEVAAVNAQGIGAYSSATLPIVIPTRIITTPGPVRDFAHGSFTKRSGSYRVTVTWKPPINDGGTPITGYVTRLGLNGNWSNWTQVSDPRTRLTGLKPGKTYSLKVRAVNAQGRGTVGKYSFSTPGR